MSNKAKLYSKLINVQNELKAPKSQFNSFGNYHYRNQEDILESVKPLLLKNNLTLFLKDEITLIGDRYYLKATCILLDTETGESIENSALARESQTKKGMDDSQVTGSTSSYARKYALNGLFLIDDTKDADFAEEPKGKTEQPQKRQGTTTGNTKPTWRLIMDAEDQLIKLSGADKTAIRAKLKDNFGPLPMYKEIDDVLAGRVLKQLEAWAEKYKNPVE